VDDIIKIFPETLRKMIQKNNLNQLEEIRIRANKPIILKNNNEEITIEHIISQEEILQIMQKACENSLYSFQNQICEGYITLKGGHRIRNYRKCGNKRKQSYKYKLYK